jgi:hypothetical protein
MPQTTDQDRAAFEAAMRHTFPSWAFTPDVGGGYHNERTESAWLGWKAARAVPLVAEAPREPLCFISSKQLPQLATRSSMYLPYSLCLVGNFDTPLYAAVPTSLAPMPEECSVSQWSSRCCERGTKGCTVSHLRTAPIPTMSDEHRQMLGEIEQEFVALPDLAAWIRRLQDRLREALASARADALLRELVVSIEEYEKVECIDEGRVRRKRRDAAFAKALAYTRGVPETDRAAMTSTTAKE